MTATATEPLATVPRMLELELTGRCQLRCAHCYNESGALGTHGTMTGEDWERVITQAAEIGVEVAQFIGGEPALHPELPGLIRHALASGLKVHVFTNLVRVTDELWGLYRMPGVSVAFSWYSADPAVHERITGSKNAWRLTRRNAERAVRLGIPVRAAIITVEPGQDTGAARADMLALGVSRVTIRPVRDLGRAAGDASPDAGQLCGRCGTDAAAILPDGTLAPCVMGRWLDAGNVRAASLAELLDGDAWQGAVAQVPPRRGRACTPDCDPNSDTDNCDPDDETVCK